MGAFVLGILVGWLVEWLFFTFWIKGRSTGKFADCTALKKEVSRKNNQISKLQSELESANKAASNVAKAKPLAAADTNIGGSKENTSAGTTKAADTSTTTTQKTVAKKKAPAKKSTPAAKTKAAPKKQEAKKAPAKKAATKKAPAKKPAVKKATLKKSNAGDDLTKLSGIGPSMASTLSELGITSYKKLADMDDDILRDMLEASGARLNNNKEAMDTWNEQAELADKGDFAGLKKLQESLKK